MFVSERVSLLSPPWAVRQHLARYLWASREVRERAVLDAACGVGYGTAMMAEEGKATRVVGLDLSPEAIDQARKGCGQIQNVEFLLGSVEELPFEDSTFDVYTSFDRC